MVIEVCVESKGSVGSIVLHVGPDQVVAVGRGVVRPAVEVGPEPVVPVAVAMVAVAMVAVSGVMLVAAAMT